MLFAISCFYYFEFRNPHSEFPAYRRAGAFEWTNFFTDENPFILIFLK
jgi:hypothetical protein